MAVSVFRFPHLVDQKIGSRPGPIFRQAGGRGSRGAKLPGEGPDQTPCDRFGSTPKNLVREIQSHENGANCFPENLAQVRPSHES